MFQTIAFFFLPITLMATWADTVLSRMTLEEKIGQLFVIPACPKREIDHWVDWLNLLKDCHIGGAILKQSDPIIQIKFLNRLQNASELPILILADAEWGLAMRMENTIAFPRNMTLGAIDDLALIEELGLEIGLQAKRVGIHMNLAPVVDINSNPQNPIIGMRSFGDDPLRVKEHVSVILRGLQKAGIMACVKHFPGHGDTDVDSHWDLPLINRSKMDLDQVDWLPFRKAINENVAAIMTAHLFVPCLDMSLPVSLSKNCLNVIREDFGFEGLIITDALNMRALTNHFSTETIAINAKKAGADLLLYGDHIGPNVDEILGDTVPRAFCALKQAYLSNELSIAELDQSVLRILRAKEKIEKKVELDDVMSMLHSPKAYELKKKLYSHAVTLVGENVFPIPLDSTYITFENDDVMKKEFPGASSECIVVAVHNNENLTEEVLSFLESMKDKMILCLFTSPYELEKFKGYRSILLAYENDESAQIAVLDILKGNAPVKGRIPIK